VYIFSTKGGTILTRCEICGKLSFDVMPIKLEGTIMHACPTCAKYGEPEPSQKPTPSLKKRNLRTKKSPPQQRTGYGEDPHGVSPGFGEKIRNVRESKGWTREQLAKKLQVKESYLAKLELEKIHPNDKMAKKIERLLEIKLISQIEPGDVASSKKELSKMTLGDVVRVLDEKSK